MTTGPGKYDEECTAALIATDAQAVLLVVLGGDRGDGFSMSSSVGSPPASMLPTVLRPASMLPAVLRLVADQIEADLK